MFRADQFVPDLFTGASFGSVIFVLPSGEKVGAWVGSRPILLRIYDQQGRRLLWDSSLNLKVVLALVSVPLTQGRRLGSWRFNDPQDGSNGVQLRS